MHQSSELSPLLFVIIMERCLESFGLLYPGNCCMQLIWLTVECEEGGFGKERIEDKSVQN